MTQSASSAECPRCKSGHEYFWYLGLYDFDVDRARELVADGREAVEVEEECVRLSVAESEMCEPHVQHVNPAYPGIIAHVRYRADDGEWLRGHVLIDGHHRAARCLQDGRPFFAHLLTEQESLAILVKSPELTAAAPLPA
jgi:hypothetical protein